MLQTELLVRAPTGVTKVPVGVLDMDIPTDRLMIGQGFNTAMGEQGMLNTVRYRDLDDLDDVVGAQDQDVEFILKAVTDYEEPRRTLNVSAAASLEIGICSASASASLKRSESHTRFNSFLMVGVRVRNPSLVLKKAELGSAARHLLRRGEDDFIRQCGKAYVYGVVTGGEMIGVNRYRATSDAGARETRLELKAAAKGYGKAGFSMAEAVSSIQTYTSVDFALIRRGGGGDVPTMDTLIAAAVGYPEQLRDQRNARTLAVYVRGYQAVENLPRPGLDLLALERQARTIETIATRMADAYQARNEWLLAARNPNAYAFDGDADTSVTAAIARIDTVIASLIDAIDAARLDRRATPPEATPLPMTPTLKVVPPPPVVVVYEHDNLGGRSHASRDSIENLQAVAGDLNDSISSIKVNGAPGQYLVKLFVHAGYEGGGGHRSIMSPAEIGSLHGGRPNWGDVVSSVLITRLKA